MTITEINNGFQKTPQNYCTKMKNMFRLHWTTNTVKSFE